MKTRISALLAVGALLVASACGGGGRPSASELSEAFQDTDSSLSSQFGAGFDLNEDVADCMGEAFANSDLSDGALRAIVNDDEDYGLDSDDRSALNAISDEITDCVLSGMDLP